MKRLLVVTFPLILSMSLNGTAKNVSALTGQIACGNLSSIRSVVRRCNVMHENILSRQHYRTRDTSMYDSNAGGNEQPTGKARDQDSRQQTIKRLCHIGGRKTNVRRRNEGSSIFATSVSSALRDLKGKYRTVIFWLALAALVWTFLLSRLFGGVASTTNYVYYQSSVIERRVIGPDGNIDTSRKESFRSNIPDLVRQQRQQQQQNTQGTPEDIEVEKLRRIDEQFRNNNEQISPSIDLLIDAERNFLLDGFL